MREWLVENNFILYKANQTYGCNWVAIKKIEDVPDCACNEKQPQFAVTPATSQLKSIERCEIGISAETPNEVWFELKAYSLTADELKEKLPDIERQLIGAWRAVNRTLDNSTVIG